MDELEKQLDISIIKTKNSNELIDGVCGWETSINEDKNEDLDAINLLKKTRQKHKALLNSIAQGCSEDTTNIQISNNLKNPALLKNKRLFKRAKPQQSDKPPMHITVPKELKYEYRQLPEFSKTVTHLRRALK